MLLAEHLVQGADVWVNTPQAPLGSLRNQWNESAG